MPIRGRTAQSFDKIILLAHLPALQGDLQMTQVGGLRHDPAQRRAGRQSCGDEQRIGSELLGDQA